MIQLSKQNGLTLCFVVVNLVLLYHIFAAVYAHLTLLVLVVITYRYMRKQVSEFIDIRGKGVLVTGCDTGIGHDLALRLESLGCTVYAGCLQPNSEGAKKLKNNTGLKHVLHLDVTNDCSVSDALQYVKKHSKETGLWAIVNNAGIQRVGDIELISLDQMKRVAEVNFYGQVRITKAFIPMIRKSKGRIVNVSSVHGRMALVANASYACTKYAIEAFSDILRREMAKFDVNVSIIEPGHFGAATAVCGKAMCDIMEKDLKEYWKSLPSDVQAMYGWEYVNTLIQGARISGTIGAPTTTACVDAMVDALWNTCPKTRYLVHGGGILFDTWAVIPVLNNYLPDRVMDLVMSYFAPCPRLALDNKP